MVLKRYILVVICLSAIISKAYGQPCGLPPIPGLVVTNNGAGCAPLNTEIRTEFTNLNAGSVITVDWGDGSPVDTYTSTATNLNTTMTHAYPRNFNVCEYTITATAVKNCDDSPSATINADITVWDDDQTGMDISGPFYVCQGFAANIQFTDLSAWNCFPGTGLPNRDPRTLQWIYGINGSNLQGVTVAGSPSPPIINGTPYTAANPGSQSLQITVPADRGGGVPHNIGDFFEVQLNNWNFCNPYPTFAPVTTTGQIVIVDAVNPDFITRLDNASGTVKTQFCPGDVVYLDNETPGSNNYNWEIFDGPNDTDPPAGTSTNRNTTVTFSTPGTKLIRLTAQRIGVIGNCDVTIDRTIDIVPVPIADIQINAQPSSDDVFQLCEDISLPAGYAVTFSDVSTGYSANTEFYMDIYDENDSLRFFFSSNFIPISPKTVNIANPGVHKAILRVVDPVTTCETSDTAYVEVYSRPTASFEIDGSMNICDGEIVDFKDLSQNFTTIWSGIPSDTITEWRWWFDYNGNPASAPDAVINTGSSGDISHTFPSTGTYDVRLQVSKPFTGVCEVDTIIQIVVRDVPNASFTPDITEGCPDLPVTLTNTSFPQPGGITINYDWIIGDLFNGTYDTIPYLNPVNDTTFMFSHTRGDNSNHQYTVQLKAVSNFGCESYSTPETITVYPAPQSGFTSDFDPFDQNCSPVPVNFEVNASTQSIPNIDFYRWIINDGAGTIDTVIQSNTNPTLLYNFTNTTQTILNYTVTLQVELTTVGCVIPSNQLVRVNPIPSSQFTHTVIDEDCDFVTVNIDALQKGLPAYNWTLSAPTINSPIFDDNFDLIFDRPLNSGSDLTVTMTLRTENITNCESVITTETFIIPKKDNIPVDLDLISSNDGCHAYVAQFENNTLLTPPGTTWDLYVTQGSGIPELVTGDVAGSLTPGAGTFSYQFTAPGNYLIELVATSPLGCTFKDNTNVTVYNDVTAAFDPNILEGCGPLSVLMNENSFNAINIQSKFWTIVDVTNGTTILPRTDTTLIAYTFENQTNNSIDYAITLDIVSNNNCTDDSTIVVTVHPESDANFSILGPDPSCTPYEVSFENISDNPVGTVYTWSWGDGTSTTVSDTDPGYDPVISHTFTNPSYTADRNVSVTLSASTPNGCRADTTLSITLNPMVLSDFLPDRTIGCAPLTVNFDNLSMGNTSTNSAWYYTDLSSGSRIQFSTDLHTSFIFDNNTTGDKQYLVEYEAENNGGCKDISSVVITVNPEVVADFTNNGPSEACTPHTATFTNNDIRQDVIYVWSWGDGTPNDTTTVETTIDHIFENNSTIAARNYGITLTAIHTITDCRVSQSKTIEVFPYIDIRIEQDTPQGCAPLWVNFTNNTSGIGLTHKWYYRVKGTTDELEIKDTKFASFELDNKTQEPIIYEIVYEVENAHGCRLTKMFDAEVYPELIPMFSADPERQVLPNKTVTVTNLTNPGDWVFHWDFGDGNGTSTLKDPPAYEYATYGDYLITLTVTDPDADCVAEISQLISIEPIVPVVDFDYDPETGCQPLTVNFKNLTQHADASSYEWDFGDGIGSSFAENPSYTYYKPGIYTVKLSASNEIGIRVTETKEEIIEVYPLPRASFVTRPSIVYLPDGPVFTQNLSVGASEYIWDFGDGTIYEEFEPQHIYENPGTYDIKLIAISEYGCRDTLLIEQAVTAINGGQVKVPNAFTPKLDGPPAQSSTFASNDIFLPLIEGVTEYKMQVYNRWGELIFETQDQTQGWDGYYNGRLSPQGVYLYKLDLKFINGQSTTRVGDVTLIR
ncbi:PKD domain-containing protein [Fulvivirgaceae bacterium BMA10]|uniref:PKD domain-containing protein n=1 Tax=Splendidivirga corallicola TaxID=3051826 RepID=A0ABT8KUW0_9BACT|nr:PKD domain-containing protein [Fulvivirgaceae bacterium BMA10]